MLSDNLERNYQVYNFNASSRKYLLHNVVTLMIQWILVLVLVYMLLYVLHVYPALLVLSYACVPDIRVIHRTVLRYDS